MPSRCCVPCCKGNYDSLGSAGRVTVFRFPTNFDLRNKWIKQINRRNYTPSLSAVVCAAHFPPEAFITEDNLTRPDGTILTVKRHRVKLVKDAFPSIFPKQPKYPRQQSVLQRTPPSKRQEVLQAHLVTDQTCDITVAESRPGTVERLSCTQHSTNCHSADHSKELLLLPHTTEAGEIMLNYLLFLG